MCLDSLDTLILVGGLGTRLRSVLPHDVPKPLAPIGGRPFLWYLLQFLVDQGINHVVLATGFLSQALEQARHEVIPPGMEIAFSEESEPLGTAGAIRRARGLLATDPVLILNGDSICLAAISPMLSAHRKKNAKASIMLTWISDARRFGTVQLGADGQISSFGEKIAHEGPGLINAGVYLISQRALDDLPDKVPCSLEYDVFPRLIGPEFYGFVSKAPFIDIGTPQSYAAAEEFFRDRQG
jgi:D-glycero-alpha-D-manno-heptose 1-phosphate guanylyltransferase